jgi:integrase
MSFRYEMTEAYQEMLKVKASLGYSRKTYESYIMPFINYSSDTFPDADKITKDMLDGWLLSKEFNTDNTRKHAIINIRHFAKFLNATGKQAYIPSSDYNIKVQHYRPYVFTDSELAQLFDSIDSVKPCSRSHAELILPVLFRMELCCGMRPNEPLNLRAEDIDLESGDIFIRKSKRGKDRHIIMSEDMRELCVRYDRLVGKRIWFFEHWGGGRFSSTWAKNRFQRAWVRSGLPTRGNVPRPYDLRHCFATRTLMRWVDEKRDIMALMPFLSTYMGHTRLEETLYYVHLLPERIKTSPGIDWKMLSEVYRMEESFHEED